MRITFGSTEYDRTDFVPVDGSGKSVHFTEHGKGLQAFQVTASRKGVTITGSLERKIEDAKGLEDFAAEIGGLVDAGWKEHRKLVPRLAVAGDSPHSG